VVVFEVVLSLVHFISRIRYTCAHRADGLALDLDKETQLVRLISAREKLRESYFYIGYCLGLKMSTCAGRERDVLRSVHDMGSSPDLCTLSADVWPLVDDEEVGLYSPCCAAKRMCFVAV